MDMQSILHATLLFVVVLVPMVLGAGAFLMKLKEDASKPLCDSSLGKHAPLADIHSVIEQHRLRRSTLLVREPGA